MGPPVVENPLPMKTRRLSLTSPIEEKIAWAENCYERFGSKFSRDRTTVDLIDRLKMEVQSSHEERTAAGIVRLCRECEQSEGGSCCGNGMENNYDGWLLLINFLLNVRLPKKRHDPKSCFFLGKEGCVLPARHAICVNYLCKKITDRIDPLALKALREKEGKELNTLFFLHENVKKICRD